MVELRLEGGWLRSLWTRAALVAAGMLLLSGSARAQSSPDPKQCFEDCAEHAQECNQPIGQESHTCHLGCRQNLRQGLRACAHDADPQNCVSKAFDDDFSCAEGCHDSAAAERQTCADAADTCLDDCGPDGVCAAGCHDQGRSCRQAAYEALESCTQPCREDLVSAVQACIGKPGEAACIKQAFQSARSCAQPCRATYRSAMKDCGKTQGACVHGCLGGNPS